jgi:hypothetical protein
MTLKEKILNKTPGIITYGLTPPKQGHPAEKVHEIAGRQTARVNGLPLDGLALYDIQDEADRISDERPFPFIHTIDPQVYSEEYLSGIEVPKIIYRVVGKYTREQMTGWFNSTGKGDNFAVFVGISADNQNVKLTLPECYELRRQLRPDMLLGGVIIPERHQLLKDEHLRVKGKMDSGCSFFISQIVYNAEASKDFLSDYYYFSLENELEPAPLIFTIAPCGSLKTLEFMKWLGVSVPKWLENDLRKSHSILDKSVHLSLDIFRELLDYCSEKNIPIGCNIESLAIRKDEIDASVYLANEVKKIFAEKGF